jgi:hypothetical protein
MRWAFGFSTIFGGTSAKSQRISPRSRVGIKIIDHANFEFDSCCLEHRSLAALARASVGGGSRFRLG